MGRADMQVPASILIQQYPPQSDLLTPRPSREETSETTPVPGRGLILVARKWHLRRPVSFQVSVLECLSWPCLMSCPCKILKRVFANCQGSCTGIIVENAKSSHACRRRQEKGGVFKAFFSEVQRVVLSRPARAFLYS